MLTLIIPKVKMEDMKNRALFDHKCSTCGSWMKSETKKSEKGVDIITYSCPECGLSYSAEG